MYYFYYASILGKRVWWKVFLDLSSSYYPYRYHSSPFISTSFSLHSPLLLLLQKYITSIQIIQFVCSFLLSIPYIYYAHPYDKQGNLDFSQSKCCGWNAFLFSCFCNLSFLLLFVQFYNDTYTPANAATTTNAARGGNQQTTKKVQ